MEAVGMILCGGYGKRLFPLTRTLPKVLLELREGYTILDHQLSLYRRAGIREVYLLAGYRAEEIRKRYGASWEGMELRYVVEKEPLGTLNAIRLGMREAGREAVVSNGDVVMELDMGKMWEDFRRSKALASLLAVRMRSPYGVLKLRGRRIVSFVEKPLLPHYVNGGVYCLSPLLLPLMERFGKGNVEQTLFPELARRGKLRCYRADPPLWVPVDTFKDLEEARKRLEGLRRA
ncbi:MAG: nucleotidyltransferase family protein [Candidatus Hadarchaeales archaeon]